HADVLKLDESSGKLHRHGELPADAHPLEKAAYDANLEALTVRELRVAVAPEAAKIRERLEQLGLELPAEQASKARWWPVLLMLAVTAFGGVKILVGLSRGKPVLFLVLACAATLAVTIFGFGRRVTRSVRGDRVLNQLRQRHAALQVAAQKAPSTLGGVDVP